MAMPHRTEASRYKCLWCDHVELGHYRWLHRTGSMQTAARSPQEIGSIQIAAAYQRELPQYRRLYRTAQIRDDTYIQLHRTEPCLPLRPTQKPAAISEQRTAPEENSFRPQTTADSTEPQTRRPSTGGQGGTDGKAPSRRPKKRRKEEEPRSLNRAPWTRMEAQEEPGLYGNKLDRNS